jgi:hypothetical protein
MRLSKTREGKEMVNKMLKKIISSIILILAITGVSGAKEFNEIKQFKIRIDDHDQKLKERRLLCSDTSDWWQSADELVLSLLNERLSRQINKEKRQPDRIVVDGIEVRYKDTGRITINYSSTHQLHYASKTEEINEHFGIGITPLKPDHSVYYIGYNRTWCDNYDDEEQYVWAGTFRIVQQNDKSGLSEIKAKQEDSNFHLKVIESKKIKYITGKVVPPCLWRPTLEEFNINETDSSIQFDTVYVIGLRGSPMQNIMVVSWRYLNNHLTATRYVYKTSDEFNDPNLIISDRMKTGEPVPIPE